MYMNIICTLQYTLNRFYTPPDVPFLRGVAAIRAFVWVSAASILLLLLLYLLLLRRETPANYTTTLE